MSIRSIQMRTVENFSNSQRGSQFDPAVIMLIMSMVKEFLEMLQDCRDPNSARRIVNNPTWLQQRVMRQRVIASLGRSGFRQYGNQVETSLLEVGKTVTDDEMVQAYAELG